jgi:hypothetical protein
MQHVKVAWLILVASAIILAASAVLSFRRVTQIRLRSQQNQTFGRRARNVLNRLRRWSEKTVSVAEFLYVGEPLQPKVR